MAIDTPVGIFNPQLVTGSESVCLPLAGASNFCHAAVQADSTPTTFSGAVNLPRSRSGDLFNNCITNSVEDYISSLLHQQHMDISNVFAEMTKKFRVKMEELHILHQTKFRSLFSELIANRIQENDREIRRLTEINCLLQEKMKRIWEENRSLRNSSQKNEAIANSLELKYNQILAEYTRMQSAVWDEDSGSCCKEDERVEILDFGENQDSLGGDDNDYGYNISNRYKCKKCGRRESSILLIPCRHLCLCAICGTTLLTCPMCNSLVSGSVSINL